jgi:hypothetical protein
MANTPDEFPVFSPLDASYLEKQVDVLSEFLQNISPILNIENFSELEIDHETMHEIITRVEKRRVYFHIYYGLQMGELNEGALICFWILKLMPFKHAKIPNSTLNTKIAYTFFVNLLFYVAAQSGKKVNVNELLTHNLIYSFKYRDLSKEALMALAESLLY